MTPYAPCPQCNGTHAEKVRFTWWGGVLGPKLLSHVKCVGCGKAYNGKTGIDNNTKIAIYMGVIALFCFSVVIFMFVMFGLLMMANR